MNLRSLHMKNYKESFFYRWPGYEKNSLTSLGSFDGTEQGAKRVVRQIAKANGATMVELMDRNHKVISRLDDPKSGKWVAVKNDQS